MSDAVFIASELAVSLTATDLAASVAWYRDVLGFGVERTFDRDGTPFAVRMRAGSVAILLTRDDGARGTGRAKGEGISLRLTTPQDVDEIAARVKSLGVTLDTEPVDAYGTRMFRLRDPDGFRLMVAGEV